MTHSSSDSALACVPAAITGHRLPLALPPLPWPSPADTLRNAQHPVPAGCPCLPSTGLCSQRFSSMPAQPPVLRTPAGVRRRLTHPLLLAAAPPRPDAVRTEAPGASALGCPRLRPSRAMATGVNSRGLGGAVHRDLGGCSLPRESLLTGLLKEEPLAVCSLRGLRLELGAVHRSQQGL